MKGNSFVPPQVATPQQYFMMNVPLIDSVSHQNKPNQTPSPDFNSAINQAKLNNLPPRQQGPTPPSVIKPTIHSIHLPAFDKVKNFMQPSSTQTISDETSRVSITPLPQRPQAPNCQQQIQRQLSPLTPQPKSSLRNGNSMKDSSVTDQGTQSKKLTFTENLVQQFPVESWKKENMENTFGYTPPPEQHKQKQQADVRPATPTQNLLQAEIDGKQINPEKRKTQPCCLLF